MSFKSEQQASKIFPPTQGATAAVNCGTTVVVVDMTSLPLSKCQTNYSGQDQTPMGKYVRITAEGGDLYWVTGNNFNALNAIPNTVVYSTVNATTGALTVGNNELDYLPMGAWKDIMFYPASTDVAGNVANSPSGSKYGIKSPVRYVAFITASGSARARFHQSSD